MPGLARAAALSLLVLSSRAFSDQPPVRYNLWYRSPADGALRGYDLRTPARYDAGRSYPAVLFLPGRWAPKETFQLDEVHAEADARGYVLVFWIGRLVSPGLWSTHYVDGADGLPDEADVLGCLDDALSRFAVDPARVHLVGFSQGGKGVLLVGLKNPDRFASVTAGAPPTDAWQGQLWAPAFPDFRSAAGGDSSSGSPEVLSRWYGQSARFFLPNGRNLPLSLRHGTLDAVVPDSPALFPYLNTHHVADTPGFGDARGRTPTLLELASADPGGYPFEARYPVAGHDQRAVLPARELFDFFGGKSRPARPARVVARHWDGRERRFYWMSLSRTGPLDGVPAAVSTESVAEANRLLLDASGPSGVLVGLPASGLDASAPLEVRVASPPARLRLAGPFPPGLALTRDGVLVPPGPGYRRDGEAVTFEAPVLSAGVTLVLAPAPVGAVAESDLLAPALVAAEGQNGARFESELLVTNLSGVDARLEALFLDGSGRLASIDVPALSVRAFPSASLFSLLGLPGGASPLRLRVTAGDPSAVVASTRVFNRVPGGGTYGLSFPVGRAGDDLLVAGERAVLFGGRGTPAERVNVSLFAPFEPSAAAVFVVAADGTTRETVPLSLAPLERVQLNDLLAAAPDGARLEVAVTAGRLQAYGTVVSNSPTNDPFRSPALPVSSAAASWTVPAVAAGEGKNGALFSSDLLLAVPGGGTSPATVGITFRPQDGSPPLAAELLVPAGTTRAIPDVLRQLFPASVPSAGAVDVRSDRALLAFGVTRSDPETGPSSQDLACVPAGGELTAGSPAAFPGVEEGEAARTNLVLANAGPDTTVALRLLTADGPRGEVSEPLAAGAVRQLASVVDLFGPRPAGPATLVVRPGPGGKVVAAAARIDNRTNDPMGLVPQPVPPD